MPGSLDNVAAAWGGRLAVAIIDLDALTTNIQTLRAGLRPGVQLMAVVKANGYGHGAVPIATTAVLAGVDSLGVATVDEGAQLRAAGLEVPILVFGAIGATECGRAIGNRLGLVVSDAGFARGLAKAASASLVKDPVSVHLKIDTGMHRFGTLAQEARDVARTIASLGQLRLDGVMTHLASADAADASSARGQVAVFDDVVRQLRDDGHEFPLSHIANSAATLRFPEFHRDMVRVGIAMYGLVPDPGIPLPAPMKPILTLHGRIARVFDLAPGDAIGYGGTYVSAGNERAALVTLGYADGYRRALSSAGWMSIRGEQADVIGRVSMDQVVVRVPDDLQIEPGEPVVIVGDGTMSTASAPTLDDLAKIAHTIGYEMATGLAPRLTRLYVRGGQVVAVSDLAGYRDMT